MIDINGHEVKITEVTAGAVGQFICITPRAYDPTPIMLDINGAALLIAALARWIAETSQRPAVPR